MLLPGIAAPTAAGVDLGAEDWRESAACRGLDTGAFFAPDKERGHARTARERRALQICQACPVLTECRDQALAAAEPYGIWGGMTEKDRRRHRRREGNSRPHTPAQNPDSPNRGRHPDARTHPAGTRVVRDECRIAGT